MAKCAVRFDSTINQYVPLLTRSGGEIGNKIMPPPSLRPGETLTPKKIGLYRSYYIGQAKNYQALLAKELDQEAVLHFAPATIADLAYNAYAGHESTVSLQLISSEEDEQNHRAFILCNPAYKAAQRLGLKFTVELNTPVTHRLFCELMDKATAYLLERPELMTDLAYLCAYQAFSLMDRMQGTNGFAIILDTRFTHHGKKGHALIDEITKKGGAIADLGMGTGSLFYMYHLQNGPIMYLIDTSQFSVSLHQRFAELIGKADRYLSRIEDITGPCSRSVIPHNGISYALIRGVLHHIDSSLLQRFSDYLFHILSYQGMFTIDDGFVNETEIDKLLNILRKRGFSATIDPDSIQLAEENRIRLEIEGRKQT